MFPFCLHCTENPIHLFPEMKLRGLVPNSYIYVSVRDLYTSRIDLPIWLQQTRQTIPRIGLPIWKWRGSAVSFLGIHQSEPDISIGFSPALHLHVCGAHFIEVCRYCSTRISITVSAAGESTAPPPGRLTHSCLLAGNCHTHAYTQWWVIRMEKGRGISDPPNTR